MKYAYDIECFKNLFTIAFVNIENEKDVFTFSVGLGKDDRKELCSFLKDKNLFIGYNNFSYDDPLLRYVSKYKGENFNPDVFKISSRLIDEVFAKDKEIIELRYPKVRDHNWKSIDLMKILGFDKLGISLKQIAINLKWKKIQEIPVNPIDEIQMVQLQTIANYNLNHVLITKKLYEEILPLIQLRENLTNIYFVDLSSASDSKIANLIFEHIYSEELKLDIRSIRESRTEREKVLLSNCMAKFIEFETQELNELKRRIASTYVYEYNGYRYSDTVYFAGCKFNLGIGGLHSDDLAGVFVSDESYLILDMDVASYYPNLIINNNFYPEHLGENFIKVLKRITLERLAAKKSGDKVKADGLKITVNSIFGKLGSEHFWLLDAKQMLSTTITGQFGLLMLIEKLYLNGITILSANTDGIVCKIPRNLLDSYSEITKEWQEKAKLELEFTPYKKYVRRDVNSYITEKEDGSTKEKGAFLKDVDLKKAYHMPIVAKALYAYFIKNIPVKETLQNCKDIMEFCISQKVGKNFVMEYHTSEGIEEIQRTNRFYVSNKGGVLIKRDMYSKRVTGLYVGETIKILNDYDDTVEFEKYNVNLYFYEKEVMKIIDEIEPKQLSLFNISDTDFGSIHKMKIKEDADDFISEIGNTLGEINRLGKNQFIRKIELIVENNEIIKEISPRYVYVTGFDSKTLLVDFYVLAKGVRQSLKLDKTLYKKIGMIENMVIYCSKFDKKNDEYSITEYKFVDKLEREMQNLL